MGKSFTGRLIDASLSSSKRSRDYDFLAGGASKGNIVITAASKREMYNFLFDMKKDRGTRFIGQGLAGQTCDQYFWYGRYARKGSDRACLAADWTTRFNQNMPVIGDLINTYVGQRRKFLYITTVKFKNPPMIFNGQSKVKEIAVSNGKWGGTPAERIARDCLRKLG